MTKSRMNRLRRTLAIAALTAASAIAAVPAAVAAWDGGAFMSAQQKGWGGAGERDRGDRDRGRGRDARQERQEDRRGERMSEDDRRSLHRDLDKANRELYGRRGQK